jgi:hypothetical protein
MMVMTTLAAREATRQAARDRDWMQALDGAGLGRRAVAARLVAAADRPPLDLCHWSAQWLAAAGCTAIRPARYPFLLVGDLYGTTVLLAAAQIDAAVGVAALTGRLLEVLVSEEAARQARAGTRIVVVGWDDMRGTRWPRPTVRWLEADQFGPQE